MADQVRLLRNQVDLLVVTSHLGLEEDEGVAAGAAVDRDENAALGPVLEQIDVIFGGHLHIVLNPPKDLPHFNEGGELTGHTVLCHSGAFAKYLGRLDLVVHMPSEAEKLAGLTRATVKAYTYKIIPINESIPEDPELREMLEPYEIQMNTFLDLTQVFALVPCPKDAGDCPKTLRNDPSGGDSQLGNLVATSMRFRRRVEADFSLTNSLGIRADFESGALSLEQMFNVFPFDNTITTMFLSGGEVQEMLDFVAARSSERGCRTQVQVAGIYFDMVCKNDDAECNERQMANGLRLGPCAKNIFLGDQCRGADGTFMNTQCRPLDPFGFYRVAVNDYIAAGGSGFTVLKRNTSKFNTGISLRDALIDFIRTLPDRCDPADWSNVVGVSCSDEDGEVFDCTSTCCCHDEESGPVRCSDKCLQYQLCAAGVVCKDSSGKSYDCTADCCGHDMKSGAARCSPDTAQFQACVANGLRPSTSFLSPKLYDYSGAACLRPDIEPHEGRIQPIAGGSSMP
jgi:5'-nucleotidase